MVHLYSMLCTFVNFASQVKSFYQGMIYYLLHYWTSHPKVQGSDTYMYVRAEHWHIL